MKFTILKYLEIYSDYTIKGFVIVLAIIGTIQIIDALTKKNFVANFIFKTIVAIAILLATIYLLRLLGYLVNYAFP